MIIAAEFWDVFYLLTQVSFVFIDPVYFTMFVAIGLDEHASEQRWYSDVQRYSVCLSADFSPSLH